MRNSSWLSESARFSRPSNKSSGSSDVLAAAVVLVVGRGQSTGCDQQLGLRSGTAGEEADERADLLALFRGARSKLNSHAKFRVHDAHHAFGLDFHVFGFQAQDDAGAFRKRRLGFDVATTQAEIGELAFGNGFGIFGKKFCGVGDDPGFQRLPKIVRKIDVANAGFAVGVGPGDFAANIQLGV